MRPDEFRVGLVGCGLLAERGYAPALRRARGLRLVAVADPVAARCERVADGLPHYPDAASLVAAQELDGLVLATPAAAHLADARLAAAAGLATLVEKPRLRTRSRRPRSPSSTRCRRSGSTCASTATSSASAPSSPRSGRSI